MVAYKCDVCHKEFQKKYNFIKHSNRKYPCNSNNKIPNESNQHVLTIIKSKNVHKNIKLPNDIQEYKCVVCNKVFNRRYNYKRHCDAKKCSPDKLLNDDEILNSLINGVRHLQEKNDIMQGKQQKMEQELTILKNGEKKPTNVTNNIQINIVAFGKEKIESYVPENICRAILNKGFKSVPALIEYIHFNPLLPELHNCYISNLRDKHVSVYDGNQWSLRNTLDVIDDLKTLKETYLETKYDDFCDTLPASTKIKFGRFLDHKDTDEVITNSREDIKLLLYNKRSIPIKTRKS